MPYKYTRYKNMIGFLRSQKSQSLENWSELLSLGVVDLFLLKTCFSLPRIIRYVLSIVRVLLPITSAFFIFFLSFSFLLISPAFWASFQSLLSFLYIQICVKKKKKWLYIFLIVYTFKWRHLFRGCYSSKGGIERLGSIHLLLLALMCHLCWLRCWIYSQVCRHVH